MDQTDLMRIKLSPLFDEKYYYTMRPDVKEAGIDAAYHYMYQGWKEHTNPSENFITDIYLANHPKVNKNPLLHYIKSGSRKDYSNKGASKLKIFLYNLISKFRRTKWCCYTYISSGYDKLVSHRYINWKWDYIAYTNDWELLKHGKVGVWKICPALVDDLDAKRNSGYHKTHPELCCKDYAKTVWIDANVNVLTNYLSSCLLKTKKKLISPIHYERNCIYDELIAIKKAKRDDEVSLQKCFDYFIQKKMPKNYGLNETCIVYRDISDKVVNEIDALWWDFILNLSKRDQASFSYVLYKYNILPKDIAIPNARIDHKNYYFYEHTKSKKTYSDYNTPIEYIKSLGVKVGKNFRPIIHPYEYSYPDFGSEPYLIEIGDDVCISFGCTFITHDAAVHVCERFYNNERLFKYGKIKVGNNVFIGCNSTILPNVTIGDNCIIGSCSVLTKSVPSNEVWAGNPAHFVSTIENFCKKNYRLCREEEQKQLRKIVDDNRY